MSFSKSKFLAIFFSSFTFVKSIRIGVNFSKKEHFFKKQKIIMIGPLFTFKGQKWSSQMRETKSSTHVLRNSIQISENKLSFSIFDEMTKSNDTISIYRIVCGPVRLLFEDKNMHFSPSNEDSIIIQNELSKIQQIIHSNILENEIEINYNDFSIHIQLNPFVIFIKTDNEIISFNSQSTLLNSKHSFDVSFLENDNKLIGLPARDSHIFLEPTIFNGQIISDPYRIYNCDTGEFRPPKEFSVYGAINFLQNHNSAIFYSNCSDTFVDLIKNDNEKLLTSHFQSECGPIDLFIFIGTRISTTSQFIHLTGQTFFPSLTDFGFSHSKWGIGTQKEVESIIDLYDQSNVLFDTFYLDIDHLKSNQPFTVNQTTFPNFECLIQKLNEKGRNLAIIEDPHLPYKKGHKISEDLISKNLAVQNENHKLFVGNCWPGPSIYPDFLNEEARKWWGNYVPLNIKIWNDMNEPSVFGSPEVTMPRDNLHINGTIEHRYVHNLYGHFHSLSSYEGVLRRSNRRPFILTRSYFTGTARHSAVWTGDGPSTLKDMRTSFHQVCTASVCGMPFIGADIGGFFGSPKQSLIELWTVNAIWIYPFLRIHAHIESESRHSIVSSSEIIKEALFERYKFSPYWYTLFYRCHTEYERAVRFACIDIPNIQNIIDEIVFVGDAIMAIPKFTENLCKNGLTDMNFEIPDEMRNKWINIHTFQSFEQFVNANCEENDNKLLPLFIKKGKIIPIFKHPKVSMLKSRGNGIELLIAPDESGFAEGCLFLDDGETRNYQNGDFSYRSFLFENGKLKSIPKINTSPKNDLIMKEFICSLCLFDGKDVKYHNNINIPITNDFLIDF
ncbi:Glucosidase 2 subunit alpha [Tritrichomonas foetus]|uniref:Glucosidase 2 subunit alpha n=1 Tax=Tritrichomonas foetus TaxID=1144522 RepID=A0A1J4JN76_9EUKA|nr:Glucosidase 2 subunit alpha [Tritrichomonas foetus]|eukprot:OHT00531.1 Glucosidase 2 subunit alpha [Tritrichomonas foetus]